MHKFTNIQIYKCTYLQIYKFTNIQIYSKYIVKYTNLQIYKFTNIRIYKYANLQIYKFTNIQIYKFIQNSLIYKLQKKMARGCCTGMNDKCFVDCVFKNSDMNWCRMAADVLWWRHTRSGVKRSPDRACVQSWSTVFCVDRV